MVVICGGGDCGDVLNSITRKFSNQTSFDKIKVLMTCSDRVTPTIWPRAVDSGHRYGDAQNCCLLTIKLKFESLNKTVQTQ